MSKQRAIIVHGFNVSDGGKSTTGRLAALMHRNYTVIRFKTQWKRGLLRDLWSVRHRNEKRAKALASIIRPGDLLIGHSNGCALIDMALHQLASLHPATVKVAYFNPALDKDAPLAANVEKCLLFYTPSDHTVWKAKLLPFHPWGEAGRTGYKAKDESLCDPRYESISYESLGYANLKHSGVFKNYQAAKTCLKQIETKLLS